MPADTWQREEMVLQSMVPQLEAEGFSVFIRPSKNILPPFLHRVRPYAIAMKPDRKIAIEVVARTPDKQARVQQIGHTFSEHPEWKLEHPEWEFRLVYAPPLSAEEVMPPLSKDVIEEHLRRIENSSDSIGAAATLLTAWAAFEAAARRLAPTELARPQTPARLVEVMASEGYVTPDEADIVRDISRIRNEVAHGRLDLAASHRQVESLIAITRDILRLGDEPRGEQKRL